MESIAGEFLRLLLAVACGGLLGFFYDIYRLFRHFAALSRRIRPFFDILWWVLAFALVFALWLHFTWGEVRFLFLVWQGLGVALYRAYLSTQIYGLAKWFLSGSARAKKTEHSKHKPLKRICGLAAWPFYALAFFIHKLAALLASLPKKLRLLFLKK